MRALVFAAALLPALAWAQKVEIPNLVEINPKLVTSGQPSASALRKHGIAIELS